MDAGNQLDVAQPRIVFDLLQQQVIQIHYRWAIYKALFFATESNIRLLSRASGRFFGLLHAVLLDDVIMGIARLDDPVKQKGRDNLVLERLLKYAEADDGKALREKLEIFKKSARKVVIRRKRLIAHSDLMTYTAPAETDPVGISVEDVETALSNARVFLNEFQFRLYQVETAYEAMTAISAKSLLTELAKAADYDAAREEGLIPMDRLGRRIKLLNSGEATWWAPRRGRGQPADENHAPAPD